MGTVRLQDIPAGSRFVAVYPVPEHPTLKDFVSYEAIHNDSECFHATESTEKIEKKHLRVGFPHDFTTDQVLFFLAGDPVLEQLMADQALEKQRLTELWAELEPKTEAPLSGFERAVKSAAEKAVLRIISDGSWVQPDYNARFKIPPEFLQDIWRMVDQAKLKAALAARLEQELADRIVNLMAAEIATDVKQILSVKERREALRALAREHMDGILDKPGSMPVSDKPTTASW